MSDAQMVEENTILFAVAGSKLYGTNLDDGDSDYMGVCIEPMQRAIGVRKPFEQYQVHSAGKGVRSTSGDYDATIYSLRKWATLAHEGNPTVLLLGFTPDDKVEHETDAGARLRQNMGLFWSRRAVARFAGYMSSQLKQMKGETGRRHSNRPELVEAHGFDTKFAYHAIRLGMQGQEFLKTGKVTLPMSEGQRDYLLAIRRGEVPFKEVLEEAQWLEDGLKLLMADESIPEHPNTSVIEHWVSQEYYAHWTEKGAYVGG